MKAYFAAKWQAFTQWACWNAWDYARKREIARRGPEFGIAPVPESHADQSPGYRRAIANEARQLLDNRHFREAIAAVEANLEAQAQACDPDNRDKAQRVVIAKQIMTGIRREIVRKAEDGYMAEIELEEINARKKPLRFVR